MEVEEGVRTRSFRYEDYNNRRVFLRSYPLHWRGEVEEEEEEEEEEGEGILRRGTSTTSKKGKRGVKGRILAVLQVGGGKALLLRKLIKNKVPSFYLVASRPFRLKPTKSWLSV